MGSRARATQAVSSPQQDVESQGAGAQGAGGGNQAALASLRGTDAVAAVPGYKGNADRLAGKLAGGYGPAVNGATIEQGGAASGALATTQGTTIHLGDGFAELDADKQDEVLAHEFAHVAQGTGGNLAPGDPPAGRGAVEADANQAAAAVLGGQQAQLSANTAPGGSYNFDWGDAALTVLVPGYGAAKAGKALADATGLTDAVADWTVENIGSPEDLVKYAEEVGLSAAKSMVDLLVANQEGLLMAVYIAAPAVPLSLYIIEKVPNTAVYKVLAGMNAEEVASLIALVAATPALVSLWPAFLMLPADVQTEVLKAVGGDVLKKLLVAFGSDVKGLMQTILTEVWPVGVGFMMDAGIGATFGYPIFLGIDAYLEISHSAAGTMSLNRGGIATEALDTGAGAGFYVGTDSGKKKGGDGGGLGIGAEVGAQAQAGLKQVVREKYEFPVLTDKGFVAFMVAATGSDTGASFQLATLLSETVRSMAPMNYQTESKFEFKVFAEGNAAAQAGVRKPGDETENGSSTWGREGKGDTGERPAWYNPMSLLRAALSGNISAEAGLGMETKTVRQVVDAEGTTVPEKIELAVYGEAAAAASIVHAIPILSASLGQLPQFDAGGGIKVKWTMTGNPDDEQGRVEVGPEYSMYGKSGEMDRYAGTASETEVHLGEMDMAMFESIDTFLQSQRGVTFKRRASVGGAFGRKYLMAMNRQGKMDVMLPKEYKDYGFRIEGYVDLEAEIDANKVRAIFEAIMSVGSHYAAGGPVLQQLQNDVMTLINTGKGPPAVMGALNDIGGAIASSIKVLKLHGLGTLGVALSGQAAEGAKVKVAGNVAAGVTMDLDLIKEGAAQPSLDEVLSLIKGVAADVAGGVDFPAAPS